MTPAATTPSAKATRRARPAAPTRARRVSGPAGGVNRGTVAVPAPVFAPPRRRVRPAPSRRLPARPASRRAPTLGARALGAVRRLPDHALLDRLIRGRVWIALLGIMLIGIVAMQVETLKLSASMGRNIDRAGILQGRNEALRERVTALADDSRIETLAARQGMVMPAPSDIAFLPPAGAATVQRAVSDIHAPAPASFLTAVTNNGAVTTQASADSSPASASTATPSTATPSTAAPSTTTPSTSTPAASSAPSATISAASAASSSGN